MSLSEPTDNLFVAGFPVDATEEVVRAVVGQYGAVAQCRVLPDNGKPDKAALVRMNNLEQAKWLVENLNGNIPVGLTSPVIVRFADNKRSRFPGVVPPPLVGPQLTSPTAPTATATSPSAPSRAAATPTGLQTGVMLPGTVKVWYGEKGFGFLVPDGGGPDVFVHRTGLTDGQMLVPGSRVSFEAQWDAPKGKYLVTKCVGALSEPAGVSGAVAAGTVEPSDNLFIAGLPKDVSEAGVKEVLAQYGAVVQCKLLPDNDKPDRAALVRMGDLAQATWLVQNLHTNIPVGMSTPISVRYAENKAQRARMSGLLTSNAVLGKISGTDSALASNRFSPYGIGGTGGAVGGVNGVDSVGSLAGAVGVPGGAAGAGSVGTASAVLAALSQLAQSTGQLGNAGQNLPSLGLSAGIADIAALLARAGAAGTSAPAGVVTAATGGLGLGGSIADLAALVAGTGVAGASAPTGMGFAATSGLGMLDAAASLAGTGMLGVSMPSDGGAPLGTRTAPAGALSLGLSGGIVDLAALVAGASIASTSAPTGTGTVAAGALGLGLSGAIADLASQAAGTSHAGASTPTGTGLATTSALGLGHGMGTADIAALVARASLAPTGTGLNLSPNRGIADVAALAAGTGMAFTNAPTGTGTTTESVLASTDATGTITHVGDFGGGAAPV